jgi:hypothetical protein
MRCKFWQVIIVQSVHLLIICPSIYWTNICIPPPSSFLILPVLVHPLTTILKMFYFHCLSFKIISVFLKLSFTAATIQNFTFRSFLACRFNVLFIVSHISWEAYRCILPGRLTVQSAS